jgi:hypothetical protein
VGASASAASFSVSLFLSLSSVNISMVDTVDHSKPRLRTSG